MKRFAVAAIAVATLVAGNTRAISQSYPERPIRLVVPISPGSVTDVIMRAAAIELSSRLGQQVVIENRAGANFIVGAQACAAAAPDGYTICAVNNNSLSINPLIYNSMPYDAQKDFTPITNLFLLVEALAVSSSVPVNSVAELQALARSKPEALNFGTLGPGSYPDLFLNWLNRKWNIKLVGVPYRGGGPVALAIASNEIQVASMGLGNFIALAGDRKLKILAVSPVKRTALLPDVPTFKEVGIGDFPGHVWWGLVGPKGMPVSCGRASQQGIRIAVARTQICGLPGKAGGAALRREQRRVCCIPKKGSRRFGGSGEARECAKIGFCPGQIAMTTKRRPIAGG